MRLSKCSNSSVTRRGRKQSGGAFVGFLLNANSTLNQWPLCHDGVPHVCNGKTDADSRRVFRAAQLQGVAIDPKAMKRLSVQPGISLKALNWSLRTGSRRENVCHGITIHEQARPDIRVAIGKKCSAGTLHQALCKPPSGQYTSHVTFSHAVNTHSLMHITLHGSSVGAPFVSSA